MSNSHTVQQNTRKGLILIALVALTPLSAVLSEEAPFANTMTEAGRQQFMSYCSSCHGLDGKGGGSAAVVLKNAPADLTQIAKRRGGNFPVDEISGKIDGRSEVAGHGSREMPVWGRAFSGKVGGGSIGEEVSEGTIKVLVDYLQSIQEK